MNHPIATLELSRTEETTKPKGGARIARAGARIVLGLLFVVAGLNGLLHFLPEPSPDSMPAGALALTVAFAKSGYLLPLVGTTQATVGVLLLANRFVPLALTILAPVVVNIVLFHVFLAPQGLPIAIVVLALTVYLAVVHRTAFQAVLASRA